MVTLPVMQVIAKQNIESTPSFANKCDDNLVCRMPAKNIHTCRCNRTARRSFVSCPMRIRLAVNWLAASELFLTDMSAIRSVRLLRKLGT